MNDQLKSKLMSSGLVIFGTLFVFTVLGLFTGSLGVGLIDIAIIGGIMVIGLVLVWRPRRHNGTAP